MGGSRGPKYDTHIKRLVLRAPALVGAALGVELSSAAGQGPTELNLSKGFVDRKNADLVMVDDHSVVHVEFQTYPDREMPHRMDAYRALLMLDPTLRAKTFRQYVVYLTGRGQAAVGSRNCEPCSFQVHEVAEADPEPLLSDPVTAPLAVLCSRGGGPKTNLSRALAAVGRARGQQEVRDLLSATVVFAGLRLGREDVERIWNEEHRMMDLAETDLARSFMRDGTEQAVATFLGLREGIPSDAVNQIAHKLVEQNWKRAMERAVKEPTESLIALAHA
jgi:hypothetical protein